MTVTMKDASGVNVNFKTTTDGSDEVPHHKVDSLPALAAGSNLIGKVQPFTAIQEGGITELIGINEQVDQNEYSASVGVSLGATYSGEILAVILISTEDDSGTIQTPAGKLLILDADPATSAGDTALAATEWPTVIGIIPVAATDWLSDTAGAAAYITDTPVPFHPLATLYFVWFHESADSFNDAAGDDEQMELNFWYRRDS